MDPFCRELNDLLVNTYRSVARLEEDMLSDLSDASLSISEMHLIEQIGKAKDAGITITEIAQAQGVTLPSVTVSVKKLEKKGYVQKQRCEEDGRRILVTLTELGRRADISHRFFHRQMVGAVERAVAAQDREVLLHGLTTLNGFFRDKIAEFEKNSNRGR
jgi:DNA-binding MarR family transcriptional regulator